MSLDPVGQALGLHYAPGLCHLSLPSPPHCPLLVPLIHYAADLEQFSRHQTTLYLDYQVHHTTSNMSLPAPKPFFDDGIKIRPGHLVLPLLSGLAVPSLAVPFLDVPATCRNPVVTLPARGADGAAAYLPPQHSMLTGHSACMASSVAGMHSMGASPHPCP